MPDGSTTIIWFRNDLRLRDNPALADAVERGARIVPLFVWDEEAEGDTLPGEASRWFIMEALQSLDQALQDVGLRLILRAGCTLEHLGDVAAATGATAVHFNRRYEPGPARHAAAVTSALREDGLAVRTFDSTLLHDVDAIRTTAGDPYRVFSPFWRRVRSTLRVPQPLDPPRRGDVRGPDRWPASHAVSGLDLSVSPAKDRLLRERWTATEDAARERLERFLASALGDYPTGRDFPAEGGTSCLSPYLARGIMSPAQVWAAAEEHGSRTHDATAIEAFLAQLGWREFGYHLLHHFPSTLTEPLHAKYAGFPWRDDRDALERWQEGRTGFPIVDAGMRQLLETGWMHNRVRMIVASFLTKDLLIPWQAGASWFWEHLVDADAANNTLGWQWAAGCGADAQPFFRIFNPVSQGKKFDPGGRYVRRWVPALENLPDRYLHAPWKCAPDALDGVELGRDYAMPIVDHGEARRRALDAYSTIR